MNPFVLSNNIPEPYFCDREEESKKLLKSIRNQEHVVLISQRRIGKTGLINHCFSMPEIKEDHFLVSIDVLHTASIKELVQELGNKTFRLVAQRSERLSRMFFQSLRSLSASFGIDPLTATPTFDIRLGQIDNPEYSLDEILGYLEQADKPCVVAIDEFQQITRYPEKNVEEILRSKIQRLTNTHFIFAGSERRIMSEMFFSAKRSFYHSATTITLGPIERNAYIAFSQRQFQQAGKAIDPEAVMLAYDYFEGVTMHVHRVLHDAYAETPEGDCCSMDLMMQTINTYMDESGASIRELLGAISEQQKELLYAIHEEGVAHSITSGAFVKKHCLKSASAVQSAAKGLMALDIITKNGNDYSLSDPLLKAWIAYNNKA